MRRLVPLLLLVAACPPPEFAYPPGAPVVHRFAVSPLEAAPGDALTVRWRVEDATSVQIAGVDSEPREVALEGTLAFTATDAGFVELLATGPGGTSRARAGYAVPRREVVAIRELSVTPRLARPDEPITVSWRTANAQRVFVRTSEGVTLYDGDAERGGTVVRLDRSVDILLTAEGFEGPVTESRAVSVEFGFPIVHQFHAVPPAASGVDEVRLEWRVVGAERIVVSQLVDGRWVPFVDQAASDRPGAIALTVTPGTHRFRLEASNTSGTAVQEASAVRLPAQVEIVEFTVTPTVTGAGGTVTVSWRTEGTLDVELTSSPARTPSVRLSRLAGSGSRAFTVASPTTFVLNARGDGESDTETIAVAVDPALPVISQFSATPTAIAAGDSTLVEYEVEADDAVLLTEDGAPLALGPPPVAWAPPVTTILTLRASNAAGVTQARRRVGVGEAPVIVDFALSATVARVGRPAFATWRVRDGIDALLFIGNTSQDAELDEGTATFAVSAGIDSTLELRVRGAVGLTASATASIQTLPRVVQGGAEVEPNDDFALAHERRTVVSDLVDGRLPVGDVDTFAVEGQVDTRLVVTTAPVSGVCPGMRMRVYDVDALGQPVGPRVVVGGVGQCPVIDDATPGVGDLGREVYIQLERAAGVPASTVVDYRLVVGRVNATCGDGLVDRDETCDDGNTLRGDGCGASCHIEGLDEIEANDLSSQATPLTFGATVVGALAPEDNDVWWFALTARTWVRVDLAPIGGGACDLDAELILLSQNAEIASDRRPCGALFGPRMLLEPGRYEVLVAPGRGEVLPARGRYRLTVSPGP